MTVRVKRAAVGLLVIAVLAWLAFHALVRRRASASVEPVAADSSGTGFKSARLFFAATSGDSLVSETRELAETQDLHDRVTALVRELDRGPGRNGVAALPAGSSVLHVYLDDRGLMTLDLSRAFQQGFHGGSNAEYLAVASLVHTLGANIPEVKSVLIVCGGAPLGSLGGHLPLDRAIAVADVP
jgi:hypothetical protein